MVTVKTHGDRTLFFDFLPFDIGNINGYDLKIQLYTVPGQIRYNSTRRLVLRGVDGIVFVADAMSVRRKKNIVALRGLQEDLAVYKKNFLKCRWSSNTIKWILKSMASRFCPLENLKKI